MNQEPLTPVAGRSSPKVGVRRHHDAEQRGWFRQLGRDIVDRKLEHAIQRLVRREKYASARIVSLRVTRELEGPLRNLEIHIAALERVGEGDPEVRELVAALRRDRRAVIAAIERLGRLGKAS